MILDDQPLVFASYSTKFKLLRLVGSTFTMSNVTLTADIAPLEQIPEAELTGLLFKVRSFFDFIVPRCIAFSSGNEDAHKIVIQDGMNMTGNLLMMTPGDPTDELLATLFQAKMTALSKRKIEFASVGIETDNAIGLSFVFEGDAMLILPKQADWIGERSYFDQPWWARDDASTLDVVPPEGADLTETPPWAFKLDAFIPGAARVAEEGSKIVRPSFKPTVIKGGKDEE